MVMLNAGALAKRFERYTDDDLAQAVAEVADLPLGPIEQACLDDIRAEQQRRSTKAAASPAETKEPT